MFIRTLIIVKIKVVLFYGEVLFFHYIVDVEKFYCLFDVV